MKNTFCAKAGFITTIILTVLWTPLLCQAGGKVVAWGYNNSGQTSVPNGLDNVKSIAGGFRHSLALKTDGTVVAWGYNVGGATNVPAGLTNVTAISARSSLTLALKADGTVVSWGGLPSTTNLANITAVAAGWYHWLALKSDGTVVTASVSNSSNTPTNIPPGLSNVTAIAAGVEFSIALKSDGTVAAWGDNAYGQTNVPSSLTNVVAIAAGYSHSLALKANGTVVTWGAIGDGIPAGLSNVVSIAAGARHSLVLKSGGTVVAWWAANAGFPDNGQTVIPTGLSNVKAIAAGELHSLALVFDGPPEIVQQPASVDVLYQSNAILSVVARGLEPLSYRWFYDGYPINDSMRVSGATTASLTISNAQFTDSRTYTVVVSNALGSVTSTGAVVTVIGPPIITVQPLGRTVRAGSDVSFPVGVIGTPPLRYQWNFNGTNILGATNVTLSLTNVQPAASGLYYMWVTNLYGTAQTIRVQLNVTNSAPYILAQPTNRVAAIGGSASFTVSARGSLPLNYQWRFNGADIPSATNATLTLSNLQFDQLGLYTVNIRNPFGETNSVKAFLNVVQVLVWGDAYNGNTNTPAGLTNVIAVAAGGSHVMALKSDGLVKVWLANFSGSTPVTNLPASVTNVIAIAAGNGHCLALRSNGTVVAWGGNGYGETNVPTGLSNVVNVAAGWSRSYAVKENGTVVGWGQATIPAGLSNVVAVSTRPTHTMALKRDGSAFVWGNSVITSYLTNLSGLSNAIAIAAGSYGNLALRKDGTVWISPGSRILLPTNLSNRVAIALNYFASMALKQDGTVTSSGEYGKIPLPILSNVTAIAIGGSQSEFGVALIGSGAPAITLQPYSQVVKKGDVVQLHARAAGVQPMSYQWQVENQNIPGATNASLIITNMQGKDTGSYRMLASNALGSAFSRTAQITIPFSTNLPAALNATNLVWVNSTNAAWFAQIRETHDGDAAAQSGAISHNQQSQLNTTVVGPGTLTFWWKVSSEAGYDFLRFSLDNQGIPQAMISGEIGWEKRTISILPGQHVLRWTYSKDGTVSSGRDAGFVDEVVFTSSLPKILRHPFDQTVSVGANVTIPAIAESSSPMTYQWLKNGTNLIGATAQYLTLTNVTLNDSATYALRVSNLYGSVTSSNAVLTVVAPQQLKPIQFLPDGSALLFSGNTKGGTFEIQASTNVKDWITLPITPILTNGSLMFHDTNCQNFPMRFYRIVEH